MEEQKRKNPWLGLESYREGEALYGRDDDIRSLTQSVLSDIDTLFYGKSGIGKSSILNAGVIPAARRHGYLPVLIRLSHKDQHAYTYLSQVASAIQSVATAVQVVKRRNKEKETLYEYFHRHTFHGQDGERIKLLIVFDQFEEIFTLQEDESAKKRFFGEMADFLNNIMPDELQGGMGNLDSGHDEAMVVDEDNLDSVFNDLDLDDKSDIPEYVTDNVVHLVFTIREDFLSEFEYYTASIPSLKQNRYGLRPINEEQASQIILRPIPGLISESVAKLIIEKVTGRTDFKLDGIPEIEVDSAVLSLYLNRLYQAADGGVITQELVNQKGGKIIADFYADAIGGISESSIEYLEDILINGQGRRDNITVYDAVNDGHITDEELDILCNQKKILRQFNYAGVLRIEYIHDILCPVVISHKEDRIMLKEQEKERLRQEEERKRQEEEQHRILEEEKQRREEAEAAAARLKRIRNVSIPLICLAVVALGYAIYRYITKPTTIIEDKYVDVMFVFNPDESLEGDDWLAKVDIEGFRDSTLQMSLINTQKRKSDGLYINGPGPDTIMVRMLMDKTETNFGLHVISNRDWLCKSSDVPVALEKPTGDSLRIVTFPITLTRDEDAIYRLYGNVVNANASPLYDAFIILDNHFVRSDSKGNFTITLKDASELMGSTLNIFKAEYKPEEIRGADILSALARQKISGAKDSVFRIRLGLRQEYDSLYTNELRLARKIAEAKAPLSAEDSAASRKYFGEYSKLISAHVASSTGKNTDTLFYYICRFSTDRRDSKNGRTFGYYKVGEDTYKPFNGYLEEIDRLPDKTRRWRMSITAYDSIYNKERILGIIHGGVIDLMKNRK